MIWATWRQHRAEAGVGLVVLAALVGALVTVGSIARDRARGLGLPSCATAGGDCGNAFEALHRDFHSIPPVIGAFVALPLLAGMFWASPLVSREYEAGTHRLAWTQTVSPLRWITVKIILIFGAVAIAALGVGFLVTWTLNPLTGAFGGRFNSTWYDIQGVVPAACMLFALAFGVAASAWLRRTVPAMALTLVVYAAARIPIHWVRSHFWTTSKSTTSVPLSALMQNPDSDPRSMLTSRVPTGAWTVKTTVFDPSGQPIRSGQGNRDLLLQSCPDLPVRGSIDPQARAACAPKLHGTVRAVTQYQPASHFWPIQLVESAIFLGLAGVLVALAVLAVTRHRPS